MKIVQKYGGSSLADAECVRRVAMRVCADAKNHQMLVVVSAQGKTTDALTRKYMEIADAFPTRESDALLVSGEQASAALLAAALRDLGVDAISLNAFQIPVYAAGIPGDGRIQRINTARIRKEWDLGRIVVVTGFQGVTNSGDYLTLGRGGSDTSAIALAAALKADRCMIFTDVDGVYSADPRKEPNAVRFEQINEDTMLNLALCGAKVLHPRAVALAKQYQVPTEVLTSFSVKEGTVVSKNAPRQTGVTMRRTGDESVITVVFRKKPTGDQLATLLNIVLEHTNDVKYGSGILQTTVGSQASDELLHKIHSKLYS